MTMDRLLAVARRWSPLGMLGFSIVWICSAVHHYELFAENEFRYSRMVPFADHLAFYTGARLTRFGPEDKLYDYWNFVADYQNRLFDRDPTDRSRDVWRWVESFRNPPFYAILYWPTCGWPYALSALTWWAISIGLIVLGVWLLAEPGRRWHAALWVFCFFPTFAALDYGQNTPISFFILAVTYVLLRRDRRWAAGLVAGLLWFKPQLLLGLGVWALLDWRRLWPCAAGTLLMGLLLAAISALVLPTASRGFIESFTHNLEFDNFPQHKMHNPLALARLLFPADAIAEALHGPKPTETDTPYGRTVQLIRRGHLGIALLLAAAAFFAFLRLYRARRKDEHVMFGGAIFLTLFAGPHVLIYEWMLLAIPGILWRREWGSRPNTWFALYACCWGILFFSTNLTGWMLEHATPAMVQVSVPVLAGAGWWAVKLLTLPEKSTTTP